MGGKSDIVKGALDLTAKLLGEGGEQAAKTGIRAYHGSPHDFDKFDISKIGTGEGAQAYGHGLYFAEHEPVAKGYRDALTPKNYILNAPEPEIAAKHGQDVLDMFYYHGGDPNDLQETINRLKEQNKRDLLDLGLSDVSQVKPQNDWGIEASVVNRADRINRLQGLLVSPEVKVNPGHMYEVNIAADPNAFLDWDKPLSEQSPSVQNALTGYMANLERQYKAQPGAEDVLWRGNGRDEEINLSMMTPEERRITERTLQKSGYGRIMPRWQHELSQHPDFLDPQTAVKGGDPEKASKALLEAGIPGVKYLDAGSRGAGEGTRNYVVFDDKLISIIRKYGIAGASAMLGYNLMENLDANQALAASMADQDYKASIPNKAYGGYVDDDIDDALRIAKDVGGSTPVLMEDAKGNKYDAQGNVIPPTNPGPNPARSNVTPEAVAAKAVNDPATFDALMERYAVPDRDIAHYEATKKAVAQQPYETQQMTHVGAKPERDVTVDMPLFGGEYSLGRAPYDVAGPMSGMAQTAYDWKTAPFYALPLTAPLAAGMDVAEGIATEDPLTASLAIGFGPGGKYAKAAGIGAANYLMAPEEAEAGPARWFSKAMEVARELPMNKMTGEQALAMLRKSVSPEELKWTGVDRFLPGEETITKQDLINYLQKNRVGTEDVVFGGKKPPIPPELQAQWDALAAQKREINQQILLPPSERRAPLASLISEQNDIDDKMDVLNGKIGAIGNPVRYGPGSTYGDKYVTRGGEDYRETLITLPTKEYGNLYQSSHWEGVPNVVGHIRTQMLDVTPPGANRPYKAFNVDEAQSDYAKAGREKGFGISKEEYNKLEMKADISRENLLRYYESLPDRHRPTSDEIQSDISRMANGRLPVFINPEGSAKPLVDSFMGDYKALEKAANALPTAPYVTSTQNWTDLSIKKALDQALDAGADYFTYTPGEVQAQRYGLSQDLQSIAYDPVGQKLEYMPKTGGWDAVSQKVPPEKLPEYIGKEMAEKLLAQEDVYAGGTNKMKVLEGDDLKLGGHGMRDYYDNIYKKRVEKVVKDATGKKVQWEVIPVQTADGPREQLGFRLSDDMKEARFSDFNKGGRVADPVVNKALALTSGY